MTTTDYLSRELRRARLSMHRAEKKPNTPESEMQGLRDKIACLMEALAAVQGNEQARAHLDRDAWEPCEWCSTCENCKHGSVGEDEVPCCYCLSTEGGIMNDFDPAGFCKYCGRPLTDAAWAELERRMQG